MRLRPKLMLADIYAEASHVGCYFLVVDVISLLSYLQPAHALDAQGAPTWCSMKQYRNHL